MSLRALWLTREWQRELEALEALATYPLGTDSFRISHGRDYFAFFARMGEVKMRALVDDAAPQGERIVAMVCGVLRAGPPQHWYLCDAKVRPSHRGQRLLIKLVRDVFLPNYARAPRGYFVAMNPSDGRPPLSVRLTDHFAFIPRALIASLQLGIYASPEPPSDMRWLSLAGVKDLVLASTNAPMSLLHATRSTDGGPPQEGHVHMWCAPAGSARAREMAERGIVPMATATVVHHRMSGFDGGIIETHEI